MSPTPARERPRAGVAAAATPQPAMAPEPPAGEPAEIAHRTLLDVRRWLAEPANAPDTQPPPAISAPAAYDSPAGPPAPRPAVVEEQVELSIGTINVTVDAPPPAASPAGRRAPAPSQRRAAVPRNYVRGW